MDGYLVKQVTSLKEAQQFLDDHAVDLVVTDWMLADGTGADVCALARKDDPSFPVIVMSGVFKEEDSDVKQCQPTVYLEKPLSIPQLFTHISALTGFTGNSG